MIKINNLLKEYKTEKKLPAKCVLSIPSFSFCEKKHYALIGVNGSGKSTFIRLLAQTLESSSGSIDSSLSPSEIGYLPQHPFMFNRSVEANVLLGLPKTDNNKEKAAEALRKVEMLDFANKRALSLSGGEAQRVAIARILMHEYKLVLLDEPTSATDIKGEQIIEKVLKQYCDYCQSTLIFATHSPAQASRLADYVLVLERGQLIESGDAHQVLYHSQNEKVRAFLNYWKLS